MNKQQKLEAIYEAMADKTLSEGCLLFMTLHPKHIFPYGPCFSFVRHCIDEYTIIGHPVRIGDVLEYDDLLNFSLSYDLFGTMISSSYIDTEIFSLWENKRLPIGDQSEECIDFVYSLIRK